LAIGTDIFDIAIIIAVLGFVTVFVRLFTLLFVSIGSMSGFQRKKK